MRRNFIRGLKILLVLAIIFGIIALVRQSNDYKKGQQDYSEAEQLVNLPRKTEITTPSKEVVLTDPAAEDPYAAMLKEEINLSALKEINSDVLGWIDIPGTELSYPILQGDDNDYYLNHTWKGEANSVGSVFFECQIDPELGDFNTIIYGHRMRDLSMFGSLKYYEDISYWEENPSVYIVIEGEAYRYDIYSAYKADPEDIIYGLKINSRPKKQELIEFGLEHSVIETGIVPTTYDRILTLSTCTANDHASRWVVQAVYRVEASSTPTDRRNDFEGADDVSNSSASNSGDSLIFPESAVDNDRHVGWNTSDINLQTIILAAICITLLAAIVIIIIIRSHRKKQKINKIGKHNK